MIKIREIICTDLPFVNGILMDVWELPPQESVELNLIMSIGYEGVYGHDDFYTTFITGKQRQKYKDNPNSIPYEGKVLFLERFDPEQTKNFLLNEIMSCDRGNWEDSLTELRKKFEWEYEGME